MDKPPHTMDRIIARKPLWRRLAIPLGLGLVVLAGGVWALRGTSGSVYRVPANQVTIGAVTKGSFEDFIAVRGAVAPLITDFLTTDQGGTVQKVLVEDGATVKAGQPLIILSNPALQLQVAAQQLAFEQTRFKYQHDVMDIEHEISKTKNNLLRDKVLLDGGAIAPSIYQQELNDYAYYVKLRAETIQSRDVEERVRATQLTQGKTSDTGAIANASITAMYAPAECPARKMRPGSPPWAATCSCR